MVLKKLFLACAIAGICAAAAAAEPVAATQAEGLSTAPVSQPDVLAPFEGWNSENAFRLGTRASFSIGGTEYYDRSASDPSLRMYSAGLNYNLPGGVSLHGAYIMQDLPDWELSESGKDSPRAWKVGFGLSQERLRFTSLMVEYGQLGAGFRLPGNVGAYENNFSSPLSSARRGFTFSEDADVLFLGARQRWNSRLSTFQRYARYEERNAPGVRQWSVGLGYQYSPGLYMELAYDNQAGALDAKDYSDKRVRLRTMISF